MNKNKIIVPAMLIAGGMGVGSMKPAPEPVQLPAPPAKIKEVEVPGERVEIRFEELNHRADSSLRKAFKLGDSATNADIVKLFGVVEKAKKSLEIENELIRLKNKKAVAKLRELAAQGPTEVQQYYENQKKPGVK